MFAKGAPQEAWEKDWEEMVAADGGKKGGPKKQARQIVAKGFADLDNVDPNKEWKRMLKEDAGQRAKREAKGKKQIADAGFPATEAAFKVLGNQEAQRQLAARRAQKEKRKRQA